MSSELLEWGKESFFEIAEIWRIIGLPSDKRDENIEMIRQEFQQLMKNMVNSQKMFLNECKEFCDYKLKEINKILDDLSLPAFTLPDDATTLISQSKHLQSKYNELIVIKNERMEKLNQFETKIKKYCHLLGVDYQPTTFATDIPNELELNNLGMFLKNQEQTLVDRKFKYDALIQMISNFTNELEYLPENEDECMVFNVSKNDFIFSQTNIAKITKLQIKLAQLYNDKKKRIAELNEKLQHLYNRLEIPQMEQDIFLTGLNGKNLSQKESCLVDIISKYEIIKKQNMEKFIINIRKDIIDLLEMCMVTQKMENLFNEELMNSSDFTEELLEKLEYELENLKEYSKCYQETFLKILEWEELSEKLIETEKKSTDPNRFNNRGGALLQIERDRKLLKRKLPKLEKDIRLMIEVTQNKHNIPFGKYGFNIDRYFETNKFKLPLSVRQNSESTKKSATKNRLPFSPRSDNQNNMPVTSGVKRNLDFDMPDKTEIQFQVPNDYNYRSNFNEFFSQPEGHLQRGITFNNVRFGE